MTLAVRVSRVIGRDVDRFYVCGMLRVMFAESTTGRGGTWDMSTEKARVVEDRICRLRNYEKDRKWVGN